MEAPEVELCPDCKLRPARPKAKGRRCEPCANRHRYLYDDEFREHHRDRERQRWREKAAERKAAPDEFFTPPAA